MFSLSPVGVGTWYTESLSSYLARLAQEHCVSLQKLVMGEIAAEIIGRDYERALMKKNISTIFGNSEAKPGINGMREMTRSLLQALENLTLRQDLRSLCCLTWKGIVSDRGLFRQKRAWCRECFEQWRLEEKPIYEPLLWSFAKVDRCLVHNCQLSDRCPHCGSQLPVIANTLRLGFCSHCKSWLGDRAEKVSQYLVSVQSLLNRLA